MKYQHDGFYDTEERFYKHKDRKKLTGKRSVKQLYQAEPSSELDIFTDPALQTLFERGLITEILGDLKSGKEATVYLADGPKGLMACKIYSDMLVRSFKNDSDYRAGHFEGDRRIKKAMDQRTLPGVNARQASWVFHEYLALWELYEAALPVPKPMVGPDAGEMLDAGRVVLMQFIGNEHTAAPRLSDVQLSKEDAASAWQQSLEILIQLANMGKVHGDYSTYNLLWWQEKVIVIDLPQMTELKENPNAMMLLERDVASLCKTFKKHKLKPSPYEVLADVKARASLL